MLKKIKVEQLTLGMHLKEFCGSWMEHPFWRTGFVLTDPKDVKTNGTYFSHMTLKSRA